MCLICLRSWIISEHFCDLVLLLHSSIIPNTQGENLSIAVLLVLCIGIDVLCYLCYFSLHLFKDYGNL